MDIDGSIRTLPLIRHHLLTCVCNTDSQNNNGCLASVGGTVGPSQPRMHFVYLAYFLVGGSLELGGIIIITPKTCPGGGDVHCL